MCEISRQIKFCSCDVGSIHGLENYWIFYRFMETKNRFVFGQSLLPNFFIEEIVLANKPLLVEQLNEPGAFDIPLNPADKDRLKLFFSDKKNGSKQLTLGFEFIDGKWIEIAPNDINWKARHEKFKSSEIQSAFLNL